MLQKIRKSIVYINNRISIKPSIGIILGSGLGGFIEEFSIQNKIPYSKIPHFPEAGIDGHEGALLFTEFKGKDLVIMQGRIHHYEGYSMEEVTYPVRVLKYLGIDTLLLSNAAGGMDPDFHIGDLMIISDHINLMPNPLIGKHYSEFGPRFPDMSVAYDKNLIALAEKIAMELSIEIRKGIYVGVTGPTYETPAEYEYLRKIGGDAVGMSTVPEVIVAHQMGIRCFGMSVITDLGVPGKIEYLSHEVVKTAAEKAEPKLAAIFRKMISDC
jgi:purine-nucleoside phosphorylase